MLIRVDTLGLHVCTVLLWVSEIVKTDIIILLNPPTPCPEDQVPPSCPEKKTHVEPEVGDIGGDGNVVVAHCFVDILTVLHQHTLWPHALFSPPGGTVQEYTLSPVHP